MLPAASSCAPLILAEVFEVTALTAEAPAPESATPTNPPAAATEEAEAVAVIVLRVANKDPEISSMLHCRPLVSTTDHFSPARTTATRRVPLTVSPAVCSASFSAASIAASLVLSLVSSALPLLVRSAVAASVKDAAKLPDRAKLGTARPVKARRITAEAPPLMLRTVPDTKAETSLSTRLSAIDTPIETETPTTAKEAARDTACTLAMMVLASSASTVSACAVTLPPLIEAKIAVAMMLSTEAPAPDRPMPMPPPAIAAEPAKICAEIACVLCARTKTAPPAVIALASTVAETEAGSRDRLISCQASGLA